MKIPGGYYFAVDGNVRSPVSDKVGNWVVSVMSVYTSKADISVIGLIICCGFQYGVVMS